MVHFRLANHRRSWTRVAVWTRLSLGAPFRLVWIDLDGTGLAWFYAPFTRDVSFKRSPMLPLVPQDKLAALNSVATEAGAPLSHG